MAVVEGRDGAMWIGTTGGLNRLDRSSGTITRYLNDAAEPGSLIGRQGAGLDVLFHGSGSARRRSSIGEE